jgi:hypothetical protein
MSKETISIEEAKKQGYKYATPEIGEGQLIPLDKCEKSKRYFLVSKEGKPFTIGNDTVKELIDDYLCNQDEVADEDAYLNDLAEKVDYSEITKKLNEAFSVTNYYYATELRLVV